MDLKVLEVKSAFCEDADNVEVPLMFNMKKMWLVSQEQVYCYHLFPSLNWSMLTAQNLLDMKQYQTECDYLVALAIKNGEQHLSAIDRLFIMRVENVQ